MWKEVIIIIIQCTKKYTGMLIKKKREQNEDKAWIYMKEKTHIGRSFFWTRFDFHIHTHNMRCCWLIISKTNTKTTAVLSINVDSVQTIFVWQSGFT